MCRRTSLATGLNNRICEDFQAFQFFFLQMLKNFQGQTPWKFQGPKKNTKARARVILTLKTTYRLMTMSPFGFLMVHMTYICDCASSHTLVLLDIVGQSQLRQRPKRICFSSTLSRDIKAFNFSCIHCPSAAGGEKIRRPFGFPVHGTKTNELLQFNYI